jgi:alpha-beta hydrolase superfamily lysophospholipase
MRHPTGRPQLSAPWETDVLGAPYLLETIPLPDDDEGTVVCSLVLLAAPSPTRRAVLYVHGFCDYFFQRQYAQWWVDRGYDFYAVDLRKYGRSLRDHQSAGYAGDMADYLPDLDEAWARITERDGHDHVIVSAHSTGGLVVALWADARQPSLAGMVLNSPWVDMHGPFWVRLGSSVVKQLGSYRPRREIPRSVSPAYGQALHRDFEGEWDYNLDWKPLGSWPVYAGWVRATRRGHARVHRGLDVPCPVLVLTSGATGRSADDVWDKDVVLDVKQMRRWATALARRVTVISVEGAIHDVVLSRSEVREVVYDELDRWVSAYAEVSSDEVASPSP